MKMRRERAPARKDKAIQRCQFGIHLVDFGFEAFCLLCNDAQRLKAERLVTFRCRQICAEVEKIGLLVIPLIAKPLDELAEKLMDWTLRRAWSPFLESCSVDYS